MVRKCLKIILILLVFIQSNACTEDEPYSDPNYPTIHKALGDREYENRIRQFESTPVFACTLLDDYGFFALDLKNTKYCQIWDSVRSVFYRNELVNIAKEAAVRYSLFTGIEDSLLLTVQSISTLKGVSYESFKTAYPDSFPNAWRILFQNQVHEGFQVRGTQVAIVIGEQKVISIGGNWFRNIYLPSSGQMSEEEARRMVYNIKMTHKNKIVIPTEESNWRTGVLMIVPVTRSLQIELRLCWVLYVGSWEITIDAYTGERISAINLNEI